MKIPVTGRNAPCPCGSGKKFKECCLEKDGLGASGRGSAGASADLHRALEDVQFTSLSEVQAFIERHTQQRNQAPVDEFHGLSPEQMHRMLHFPFASPELIRFPETLDTNPKAPILTLFSLLAETIGGQGLKPTAKGNLPRKFCREAALAYWGETAYRENTLLGSINREDDFPELHITRLVAELAGLIRKYKGRFILSRDCRALLAGEGPASIYPRLFRVYVEQFNWAYRDRYIEHRFIQASFLFTLYLLTLHGENWLPQEFYEDGFLRAFPMVLDEVPPGPVFTPEEEVRLCYTWRTLVNFVGFFGLATVDPVSEKHFCYRCRVKSLPLLREAVQFHVSG